MVKILTSSETKEGRPVANVYYGESDAARKEADRDKQRALDILGSYYMNEAKQKRTKEERQEVSTRAAIYFTTADKLSMYDQVRQSNGLFF